MAEDLKARKCLSAARASEAQAQNLASIRRARRAEGETPHKRPSQVHVGTEAPPKG